MESTSYFDFVFKAFKSRNSHRNKTSTHTFHKITYNTIILARRRRAIQFLDLNFLYISIGSRLFNVVPG